MAPLAILAVSNITRGRVGKYDPSRSLYSHLGPIYPSAHSQLYSNESPILTVKQVASLRQYHAAYAGGHLYVWNVIFGLAVGLGGRGFGVVRLEQASVIRHTVLKIRKIAT